MFHPSYYGSSTVEDNYGADDDYDDYYDPDGSAEEADDPDFVLVERGPASTVCKTWKEAPGSGSSAPQWIAVKTSTTNRKFSPQPHDVVKEVRLLSSLSHVNIVALFDYTDDRRSWAMHLWMPFIPFSLDKILDSPSFSPFPPPPPPLPKPKIHHSLPPPSIHDASRFFILSKSFTFQTISAIAYLHDPRLNIAHRDIKPRNLLVTNDGCIKLIDFGISWKSDESEQDQKNDLWPERPEEMCTAVSTGPYRAPELLFGPKSYNAFSTDLWSLGTTLSQLFTPLRLVLSSSDGDDDDDNDGDAGGVEENEEGLTAPPFIYPSSPSSTTPEKEYKWERTSLFNGRRGELGLLWSIFKTMGTPNESNWPGFKDFASARSVTFRQVPGVPLESRLSNLPPSDATSESTSTLRTHALDLISRLLAYPPEDRLGAKDALSHRWLTSDAVPLLLPPDYPLQEEQEHLRSRIVTGLEGRSLGYLIKQVLDCDHGNEGDRAT